jgi:hypothetical protein
VVASERLLRLDQLVRGRGPLVHDE